MALRHEHSDIEDPFSDSSIFSLLPRTLGITSVEPADAPKTQELDSFQSFIKSLTIKGSKELLDQAQVIHKTSSSILSLYSDGDKVIVENGKGQPQVRRLALGRKRAQFSLKSDSRAPLVSLNVNSSIDHIEDPEEYFLAFEKLENAGKELKKLRGDVSDELPPNHSSPATRNRRPGILGKTASYKHHFPSQKDAVLAFPHDGISDRTVSSPSRTSDKTILGDVLQTGETDIPGPLVGRVTITDSFAEKENNVDHILDELLSSFKDVDGNEEVSFLRAKLQIRSIDVGKVSLPEITSFKRKDAGVVKDISRKAEGSLQGMSSPILLSSPLAAISILQRRIPLKSPVKDPYSKHLSDNIEYAGGSSLIGGQGPQDYPVGTDHSDISGSIPNISSTPVRPSGRGQKANNKLRDLSGEMNSGVSSLIGGQGQPHYPVGTDHSDISCSLSYIASTAVRSSGKRQKANNKLPALSGEMDLGKKTSSQEPLTGNDRLALERNTASPPKGFNIDNDITPVELDSFLQDEGNNVTVDAAQPEQPEPGHEDPTSEHLVENGTDRLAEQLGAGFGESAYASPSRHDHASQDEGNNVTVDAAQPEQPEPGHEDPTSEHLVENGTDWLAEQPGAGFGESAYASPSRHDHASQDEVDDVTGVAPVSGTPQGPEENSTGTQATILLIDEQSEEPRSIPEGNSEEQDLPANSETLKRGTKRKAHSPKRKKQDPASKRYSLAGAGTTWNAGLRRSTRIKSRPLEYWCGERFIYGRVHDSLATVIGVKYASPSTPNLKVKSFVSDEYADLVAKASLY